jgi:hypothetical protein
LFIDRDRFAAIISQLHIIAGKRVTKHHVSQYGYTYYNCAKKSIVLTTRDVKSERGYRFTGGFLLCLAVFSARGIIIRIKKYVLSGRTRNEAAAFGSRHFVRR